MKKKTRKGIANRFDGTAPERCPYCRSPVVRRSADGIYKENDKGTELYVCSQYPKCDAYVRIIPGTNRPIGTMANGDLRALRTKAHQSFNRLYLSGLMTKQAAYQWLAMLLQAPMDQAHIGLLSEYYCQQVIVESGKLMERRQILQWPDTRRTTVGGAMYAVK